VVFEPVTGGLRPDPESAECKPAGKSRAVAGNCGLHRILDEKSGAHDGTAAHDRRNGYKYYFEFTVTAYGKDIERNLPEKQAVIDTFRRLSDKTGPKGVDWRFDPILKNERFTVSWIAEQYAKLCEQLHDYTERCIISFVDEYSHTRKPCRRAGPKRNARDCRGGFGNRRRIQAAGFHLRRGDQPEQSRRRHSSCIDREKIEELIGVPITAKKDTGQRPACGCIESVDVGAYDTCGNGCAYCYAVTSEKILSRRMREHDPRSPLLTGRPKGTELITDRTVPSQKVDQLSLFV
jgi:hypothetical protein